MVQEHFNIVGLHKMQKDIVHYIIKTMVEVQYIYIGIVVIQNLGIQVLLVVDVRIEVPQYILTVVQ